jgi:hypothetical protein
MTQAPDAATDRQAQAEMSAGGTKLPRLSLKDEIAMSPLLSLLLGLILAVLTLTGIAVAVALLVFVTRA